MKDIKLVLGVVLGSGLLVLLMIWGLSKLSTDQGVITSSGEDLVSGAGIATTSGQSKVEIVVFSDMQCPACKVADEYLKTLRDKDGVTYVMRHFPLNIHKNAMAGARAVEAARLQGKAWEMIDTLFAKQSDWESENKPEIKFVEYAKGLGLETNRLVNDMNLESVSATISADLAIASRLRLPGTPSIFVNGEMVSTQFVASKVEELLKK